MAVKVDVGMPQIEPQVEIGEPIIESSEPAPKKEVRVSVGMPQIDRTPQYAVTVGDPIIEQAMPGQPPEKAPQDIPFSDFYAALDGNPALAEKVLPGITSDAGLAMMRVGQDGRPTLRLTPEQAAAFQQAAKKQPSSADLVQQKLRAILGQRNARQAASETAPTHVPPDQFAQSLGFKSFADIPAQAMAMLLPGMDEQGGMMPYMVRTQTGDSLLVNPQHPLYEQTKAQILNRRQNRSAPIAMAGDM